MPGRSCTLPRIGDQLFEIRSQCHGRKCIDVGTASVAYRKSVEQVAQRHQYKSKELTDRFREVARDKRKLQHRDVAVPVQCEAILPDDVRRHQPPPSTFCWLSDALIES